MADVEHPTWCSPLLCRTSGADVFHAETGGVITVASTDELLAVSAVSCDEIGEHGQTVHPAEVLIRHGDDPRLCLSLEEASELAELLASTVARTRTPMPAQVS